MMNEQETASKLATAYLDDFTVTKKEVIKSDAIVWTGNIAQFKDISLDRHFFGYLIITKEKIIRVLFKGEYEDDGWGAILGIFLAPLVVPVILVAALFSPLFPNKSEEKPTFGKIRKLDPKKKRQEITVLGSTHRGHSHGSSIKIIPATPLTYNEISSRELRVFPFQSLASIDRFESQDDHSGEKIVELDIHFASDEIIQVVFYKEQDANDLYDILLSRLQQNAILLEQKPDISGQLEKLAELHNSKVITDEEYSAAKERLLRR